MVRTFKSVAVSGVILLAFGAGVGVRYYSMRSAAKPQLAHVNQLVITLQDRTKFPVVEVVQFFSKTYEMHVTIAETTWADWEQQQSFYRIAIPTEIGKAFLQALQDDGIRHPTAGVVFLSTSGRTVALYAPALGGFQFLEGR